MSIFANLRHCVPTTTLISSNEFEFQAEIFESTVPKGMFREQDFGVVIVIDRAGLAKRGALAGYATYDAALKAVIAIVRSSGLRPVKLTQTDSALSSSSSSTSASTFTSSRSSASFDSWNCNISGIISNSGGTPLFTTNNTSLSTSTSSNTFFFTGTAEALQLSMARLRLAAWLLHSPGRPDVGRFYAVYPRGPQTAKYVAQDTVFNEV